MALMMPSILRCTAAIAAEAVGRKLSASEADGDEALTRAVLGVRERGGIIILVTHRQTAIAGVDQIAMMADGRIQAFGPKEEILQKVMRQGGLPSVQRQPVAS